MHHTDTGTAAGTARRVALRPESVVLMAAASAPPPGMNVLAGRVTYEAVAEAHGLPYTPLAEALAAVGGSV